MIAVHLLITRLCCSNRFGCHLEVTLVRRFRICSLSDVLLFEVGLSEEKHSENIVTIFDRLWMLNIRIVARELLKRLLARLCHFLIKLVLIRSEPHDVG